MSTEYGGAHGPAITMITREIMSTTPVPPTNMTPYGFCDSADNPDLSDTNAHKPVRIASHNKEWIILSYYEDDSGHMCIDIEPCNTE